MATSDVEILVKLSEGKNSLYFSRKLSAAERNMSVATGNAHEKGLDEMARLQIGLSDFRTGDPPRVKPVMGG
jgi:hypothetical protein